MKEINQVPGNTSQETPAPFEIVIRTTDPEYLAHGGLPELTRGCNGYFAALNLGGKTQVHVHGDQNLYNIVRGLIDNFGAERVTMAALSMSRK